MSLSPRSAYACFVCSCVWEALTGEGTVKQAEEMQELLLCLLDAVPPAIGLAAVSPRLQDFSEIVGYSFLVVFGVEAAENPPQRGGAKTFARHSARPMFAHFCEVNSPFRAICSALRAKDQQVAATSVSEGALRSEKAMGRRVKICQKGFH